MFVCVSPVRQYFVEPKLVHDHPIRLACVATIEILTKWKDFGIPMSHLKEVPAKELGILQRATAQTPSLSHGCELLSGLAHNKKRNTMTFTSVFRDDMTRCHWKHCPKTGPRLKACSGCTVGKHSVAFYCSAAHQKQHWKTHKPFCKAARSACQGP